MSSELAHPPSVSGLTPSFFSDCCAVVVLVTVHLCALPQRPPSPFCFFELAPPLRCRCFHFSPFPLVVIGAAACVTCVLSFASRALHHCLLYLTFSRFTICASLVVFLVFDSPTRELIYLLLLLVFFVCLFDFLFLCFCVLYLSFRRLCPSTSTARSPLQLSISSFSLVL